MKEKGTKLACAALSTVLGLGGCKQEDPTMRLNEGARPEYMARAIIDQSNDPMGSQSTLLIYDHEGNMVADEAVIVYGMTPTTIDLGMITQDKWDHFVVESLPYEKRFVQTDNTTTMTPEFRDTLNGILELRKATKRSLKPRNRGL